MEPEVEVCPCQLCWCGKSKKSVSSTILYNLNAAWLNFEAQARSILLNHEPHQILNNSQQHSFGLNLLDTERPKNKTSTSTLATANRTRSSLNKSANTSKSDLELQQILLNLPPELSITRLNQTVSLAPFPVPAADRIKHAVRRSVPESERLRREAVATVTKTMVSDTTVDGNEDAFQPQSFNGVSIQKTANKRQPKSTSASDSSISAGSNLCFQSLLGSEMSNEFSKMAPIDLCLANLQQRSSETNGKIPEHSSDEAASLQAPVDAMDKKSSRSDGTCGNASVFSALSSASSSQGFHIVYTAPSKRPRFELENAYHRENSKIERDSLVDDPKEPDWNLEEVSDDDTLLDRGHEPDESHFTSFARKRKLSSSKSSKVFRCTECPASCMGFEALDSHLRTHNATLPYKCGFCTTRFVTFEERNAHRSNEHKDSNGKYQCAHCLKTFTDSCNALKHIRSHTGERQFQCDQCFKSFKYEESLKRHSIIHAVEPAKLGPGEKDFNKKIRKCDYCTKSFESKRLLKQHQRVHTGERTYKCDHCFKSFNQKASLIHHVRTHTGEKPYVCDICLKTFGQKHSMLRHKQTHRSESTIDLNQLPAVGLEVSTSKTQTGMKTASIACPDEDDFSKGSANTVFSNSDSDPIFDSLVSASVSSDKNDTDVDATSKEAGVESHESEYERFWNENCLTTEPSMSAETITDATLPDHHAFAWLFDDEVPKDKNDHQFPCR